VSRIFRVAELIMFACLSLITAEAQVSTGTIVGTVQDSTGGVVPNATVKLANVATAEARQVQSNAQGQFNAPFLPLGEYTVTVTATGFKVETLTNINLQVDQTANLHITLQLGSVDQTVEVTSSSPLVDSVTSSLGQVIDNKQVLNMPLNGRNPFALGLLVGNTAPVSGVTSNLPFIGGGGRFQSVDISLNGIDNNAFGNSGDIGGVGIAVIPSVDAVQEFKVMTNNFAAEYGHAAGSIVSATIKSGTNQYHGVVFEFLRNDDFDANNYFTNLAGLPRAPFHQNQFGGTLGGPIVHNRIFFFGDYQGTRQTSSSVSSIENVPPLAFRSGDFSQSSTIIYDPRTRHVGPSGTVIASPFPGNVIPASLINPTAEAIEGLVPAPNFGDAGAVSRNFAYAPTQSSNTDQGDVRIDATLTQKNSVFGSYSISNNYQPTLGSVFPGFIGGGEAIVGDSDQVTLSDIHTFSSSLINQFRVGYLRNNYQQPGVGRQGVSFANQAGLALFPSQILGFPSIGFNYSAGITGGTDEFTTWGGGDPKNLITATQQYADDLSWTRHSHSLKFGVDIRRSRFDTLQGVPYFALDAFSNTFSSSSDAPNSGLPFADFLMGDPTEISASPMIATGRQRVLYFGGYAQDDWKVTNKMTLNLGLRYELYSQPIDVNNLGSLFDITTGEFALPGQGGFSRAIVPGDHTNIAPRLGFAYQLSRKVVVRGGYGIFYSARAQNQGSTLFSGNAPNVPAISLPSITAANTVTPPYTLNTPITALPQTTSLASFTPANPYSVTIITHSLHQAAGAVPRLSQYNLDLQYQTTNALLFEASYSGALGGDLASAFSNENQVPFSYALTGQNTQANRPFPNVGTSVYAFFNNAASYYNALNLKAEERLSHGLEFLANFTWAKNIGTFGDGPTAFQQSGSSIALDTYDLARERGVTALNIKYIYSTSLAYELPFGPGRRFLNGTGVAPRLLGGWVVNGILSLRTGFPTDIETNVLPPIFATFNVASCVPGVPMKLKNAGVNGYFNPAAFAVPQVTQSESGATIQEYGNCGRRIATGPGVENLDSSVFKNFYFTHSDNIYLQFRTEFFNTTNTPAFSLPKANDPTLTCEGPPGAVCNAGNANFGKLSDGTATGRQIQFAAKLYF
jgi:hypothetical protein